ncbi:Zn-ribbon domain-containing OB-fold protein [Saccharolobus islandicus]|uniref:ChsH2 rubredoxin-like zinc ribbon domain-containing protein n=4 Tax=Saccharolobus islandicus TaxID=43080 RepID=C4KFU7_SACI6|nr:zinc ribbon domain-containing protein [Sulfolobus islandicus]ACP37625.1 protein of unknown function DUF35 [Sulfolobus islandicus M.14.25]ACP54767.1 protein of unknown function DUF35 [Sulfolobus islandicus M.16.27]ACR41461.1 protein of unknown function DUF35 [Sulfolobus islandicus M.16.4]
MNLNEIIQTYYEYFNKEKLPYIKCTNCGHVFYYPRAICPKCLSNKLSIMESKGEGEIYSETKFVNEKGQVTIVGLIKLEERFMIYANILTNRLEEVSIDKKVKVKFKEVIKGQKFPFFTTIS